jgi:hypothetical protein
MKLIVLGCAQLDFKGSIHLRQLLDLKPRIRRRIDGIVDGGAVVCIALEFRGQREKVKSFILILFRGVARREQLHDFIHPLAVKFGILRGLRRGAQVFLKLDREARIIPEREECVRLHVDDVFFGLQVGLEHRLASDGKIVGRSHEGISFLILLSRFVNGVSVRHLGVNDATLDEGNHQRTDRLNLAPHHGFLASSTFSRPSSMTFTFIR